MEQSFPEKSVLYPEHLQGVCVYMGGGGVFLNTGHKTHFKLFPLLNTQGSRVCCP